MEEMESPQHGEDVRVVSHAWMARNAPSLQLVDLVIVDEAHYCKSITAARTRVVLREAKAAKRAWLLSGTPMPNNPAELWAPIKALWPHHAPDCTNRTHWIDKFCELKYSYHAGCEVPSGVKNADELRDTLNKFMLRRTLDDVGIELPPLRTDLIHIPKSQGFDRHIADWKEEHMIHFASFGDKFEDLIADVDIYLSSLRRLLGLEKVAPVANLIVDELKDKAYDSVVVMYHHRDVGSAFAEVLDNRGYDYVQVGGGTYETDRSQAIHKFQMGRVPVFLGQQLAAGVGIELSRASEIVLLEPDWVPKVNEQAIKRIHRIGQDRPCRARIFAMDGTVDDSIIGTIARKMDNYLAVGLE